MLERSSFFDLPEQLAGYGAYHSNPTNIGIHQVFVPFLIWTFQALGSYPVFVPALSYKLNDWMQFDITPLTIVSLVVMSYYVKMEPVAALLYLPQGLLSLLTATSFARHYPHGVEIAAVMNVVSWVAQFAGHRFAEGRAPALLDNIVGAFILAPFFVHIENLFYLGYNRPLQAEMAKRVQIKRVAFEAEKKGGKKATKKEL